LAGQEYLNAERPKPVAWPAIAKKQLPRAQALPGAGGWAAARDKAVGACSAD